MRTTFVGALRHPQTIPGEMKQLTVLGREGGSHAGTRWRSHPKSRNDEEEGKPQKPAQGANGGNVLWLPARNGARTNRALPQIADPSASSETPARTKRPTLSSLTANTRHHTAAASKQEYSKGKLAAMSVVMSSNARNANTNMARVATPSAIRPPPE